MKTKIIPGCSSFNERYWQDVFYPEDLPRKDWFTYYCRHFDTYEMNGTFYRFPTSKALANWYDKSPKGFQFSVKMYKTVTHLKKFVDCEREIAEFYAVCRNNLKEKLACVLFQLPRSFSYSEDNLELLLESLDYSFTNVVEFRNAGWWRNNVFKAFAEHGIIFCTVSYPNLPEGLVKTASEGYVRLHGVPKLFYSGYGENYLSALKDDIGSIGWDKAFIYFNNTASTEGILDALEFRGLVNGW